MIEQTLGQKKALLSLVARRGRTRHITCELVPPDKNKTQPSQPPRQSSRTGTFFLLKPCFQPWVLLCFRWTEGSTPSRWPS